MKPLTDLVSDPKKVLEMEPEQLGPHVLHCISKGKDVKRANIARDLAAPYHEDFRHKVAHVIEEAIGWLEMQCLMGATPYDQDLIFVTRRGQKFAEEYGEIPADVTP